MMDETMLAIGADAVTMEVPGVIICDVTGADVSTGMLEVMTAAVVRVAVGPGVGAGALEFMIAELEGTADIVVNLPIAIGVGLVTIEDEATKGDGPLLLVGRSALAGTRPVFAVGVVGVVAMTGAGTLGWASPEPPPVTATLVANVVGMDTLVTAPP